MSTNPGLTSRFPEVIDFRALNASECVELLTTVLAEKKKTLQGKGNGLDIDIGVLETRGEGFRTDMLAMFKTLVAQDNWASARDVRTLADKVFRKTIKPLNGDTLAAMKVTEAAVIMELRAMMLERNGRSKGVKAAKAREAAEGLMQLMDEAPRIQSRPQVGLDVSTPARAEQKQDADLPPEAAENEEPQEPSVEVLPRAYPIPQRDAGVSDETWEELQRDRAAGEAREEEFQRLLKAKQSATDRAREEIVKRIIEEEKRRRKEAEVQKMLESRGLCPAGYQWIRQDNGYRCGGGSHFIGDDGLKGM